MNFSDEQQQELERGVGEVYDKVVTLEQQQYLQELNVKVDTFLESLNHIPNLMVKFAKIHVLSDFLIKRVRFGMNDALLRDENEK